MADFERLLPSESSTEAPNPKDRGWRFRLLRIDGEGNATLYEEQVLPERVNRLDARRFISQKQIDLTPIEQAWLRDQLTEMLGEVADVEALKAEIEALRAQVRGEEVEAFREFLGKRLEETR